MSFPVCVCIPARNEAEHIGILIEALGEQRSVAPFCVALCVNNSDDDTVRIAEDTAQRTGVTLTIIKRHFDAHLAHAGSARRAAMDLGATLLDRDDGLLISTDADCRPPPDWIAANRAVAAPDRIVGGRIALDEEEALRAPAIFALRRRFDAYWQAVRAIEDDIDPLPWDPAPRHGDHTGASLALSVGLYRKAGGVPLLPTGEDRALVDAAVRAGGHLVHPEAVWTRASARTVGRATAGMANDLQGWIDILAQGETPQVPAFAHWRDRALWRRDRRAVGAINLADAESRLPAMPCDMNLPDEVAA